MDFSTARGPSRLAPAGRPAGLLFPSLITFASGFAVMVVELVASRLTMGYIGQSLYTWTGVIGVILAGISAGNYLGGWLVDRWGAQRLMPLLFALSAAACACILPSVDWIGQFTATWIDSDQAWITRIITVISVSFFLPGLILGTISPAVAKWALDRGMATGQTVGTIYAWNNVGSIVGTFVAGFDLINRFDVKTIILLCAALMGLLAFTIALAGAGAGAAVAVRPRPRPADRGGRGTLILPILLVFTSGFVVMLVELVVSRFICGHIGQSLYTWTSVIGVILAGISLGNYLGGKLADRFDARQLVGTLFLFSSIATLSILITQHVVGNATMSWIEEELSWLSQIFGVDLRWGFRVLAVVFAAFFLAPTALGTISPAVAKWALDQGYATGRTVGTIYAWNVLGSICGTFATGFWLISRFHMSPLIATTSLVLALFALGFATHAGPWVSRLFTVAWLPIAGLFFLFATMPADRFESAVLAVCPIGEVVPLGEEDQDDARQRLELDRVIPAARLVSRYEEINFYDGYDYRDTFEYYDESNYYTIKVSEETVRSNRRNDYVLDADNKPRVNENGELTIRDRKMRQLVLDALIHGYMDMSDFSYLHYEYEHIYASVSHRILRKHKAEGQELKVLFLGGGSYTFPRYLTALYGMDNIHCDVAEIDPRVTLAVQRSMGLNALNQKRILLLGPGGAPPADAGNPEPVANTFFGGLAGGIDLIRRSFSGPTTIEEKGKYHEKRIEAAGAIQVRNLTSDTNYLLDVREDTSLGDDVIAKAKELGIKVIDAAEFEVLYRTTSHPNIVTTHRDARQYIMQSDQFEKYDVIYGDAFNDFSVPAHLTTKEFNTEMAKLLKPDGVFLANIIDIWSVSKFMGAYRNTLSTVFKHFYLVSTDSGQPSDDRSTFVLVCSNVPMDLTDLGKREEDEKGLSGYLMEGNLLGPVIRGGKKVIGTATLDVVDGVTDYELPKKCEHASVEIPRQSRRELLPSEFKLETVDDATSLVLTDEWDLSDYTRMLVKSEDASTIKAFELDRQVDAYPLKSKWDGARVTVERSHRRPIRDFEYELIEGKTIRLDIRLPPGTKLRVTLYSDEDIILTDAYCPVDNMLAEVIATRVN